MTSKSDLATRTLSGLALIAIGGTALWLGGIWFAIFAAAVAVGVLIEWWQLVRAFVFGTFAMVVWLAFGIVYIGLPLVILLTLRSVVDENHIGLIATGAILLVTIAIDVGAYFAGRTFGGPKIAPSISPSKTWAGLGGAMVAAAALLVAATIIPSVQGEIAITTASVVIPTIAGATLAVVAQTGDFFESWMKRRAGVKDSGTLIPGHGGLFDRVDGLLPVTLVAGSGLLALLGYARGLWSF